MGKLKNTFGHYPVNSNENIINPIKLIPQYNFRKT